MTLNDTAALVDTCFAHVLKMADQLDDLKKRDPTDDMEDLPKGFTSYVDGSYQQAVLCMFTASGLLSEQIAKARAG